MRHSLLLLFASTAIVISPSVFAADPATLQNTVERYDPGKTASEIAEPDLEREALPTDEVVDVKSKSALPAPAESKSTVKFQLTQVELIGNCILTTQELQPLYAKYLNTEITLDILESIAQRITEYYRNAGYILSQAFIPPQEIDQNGVVKIKIVEGYVSKVMIMGSKNSRVYKAVKAYGDKIAARKPLNLESLERFSYLANDIPGVKVRAVLSKSQETLGAADLTLVVEEQTFGGYAAFNNYNQEVLGRQQVIGNVYVNNLTYASQTSVNGILSTNTDRMRYIAFNHRQQLNSNGLGGRLSISNINTTPDMGSIGIGGLEIPGKAFIATVGLDYAYLRSHNRNIYLGTGFKLLNSTTEFGEETLFKDNVRSINVSAVYDYMPSLNTNNTIALTLTQGLKIFDAQGNPPSRYGENLTFTKLDLYASNLHYFKRSKFSSFLAFKGQFTFSLLPSSETFNYGGVPFGYGYDPSEFSGDRGIAALGELRYASYSNPKIKLLAQTFAFFDFGYVWDLHTNVQPTMQYGTSTGVGQRVNLLKHVNLDFIVGVPLKNSSIEGTPNFVRLLFNIKVYA